MLCIGISLIRIILNAEVHVWLTPMSDLNLGVVTAAFTREEVGAFFKESDAIVQVSDLLLKLLHTLLLAGPWWRAGGGHKHCSQHLLVGFTQRPAEMENRSKTDFKELTEREGGETFKRNLCVTSLNALPAQRGLRQGSRLVSPLILLQSPPGSEMCLRSVCRDLGKGKTQAN